MAKQIKVSEQTKSKLDELKYVNNFPFKSYDQKVSYLLWFHEMYNEPQD